MHHHIATVAACRFTERDTFPGARARARAGECLPRAVLLTMLLLLGRQAAWAQITAVHHGRASDLGELSKRKGAFSYPKVVRESASSRSRQLPLLPRRASRLLNYGPSPHFLLWPRVPTLGFHVGNKTGPRHLSCALRGWGCY